MAAETQRRRCARRTWSPASPAHTAAAPLLRVSTTEPPSFPLLCLRSLVPPPHPSLTSPLLFLPPQTSLHPSPSQDPPPFSSAKPTTLHPNLPLLPASLFTLMSTLDPLSALGCDFFRSSFCMRFTCRRKVRSEQLSSASLQTEPHPACACGRLGGGIL